MKQGRCSNYGGCSKADSGEIIEVDEFDDFICPECGHDLQVSLQPVTAPKKIPAKTPKAPSDSKGGKTKLFIIIGAVVAIGIIAAIVLALLDSDKQNKVADSVAAEATADDDLDMYKDEDFSEDEPFEIEEAEPVEAEVVQMGKVPVEPVSEEKMGIRVEEPKQEKVAPVQTSSHKLSYGTWSGAMKNGKPHGAGTMTYSTSCVIDARDSKGRVAEPGEYVVGEWDNGNLIQGRWFKNDGSKEAIIIGKAG